MKKFARMVYSFYLKKTVQQILSYQPKRSAKNQHTAINAQDFVAGIEWGTFEFDAQPLAGGNLRQV